MNQLRPGQIAALNSFEKHYYENENDKGILSACCGFGKTRLCYELIKKCMEKGEKRFIIATSRVKLLGDLAMQTKKWCRIENLNMNVYRVGGSDEVDKKIRELRDSKDIHTYFKTSHNSNPVLIITTYKSSEKILKALKDKEDSQPDLIIFDEAHNTAGGKNKYHQQLMHLTSEKKLFMTATPLSLLFKNKDNIEGNYLDDLVYSMDNTDTYGEIFFEYTFADGIRDKIIVDFKCITLGKNIDKGGMQEFKNLIKDKSKAEKQEIYFKMIGKYLLDAMTRYKLKHTLVFLSDQMKVQKFKKILDDLEIDYQSSFHIYSIVSNDSTSVKKKNENNFKKEGDSKILLSVGIYNEGVDIECIDSVFFAQERTSPTTIVQNIGRCVRTHKDSKGVTKDISYVLLPNILYESGESWDDETLYSSKFKQIRKMIQILGQNNEKNYLFEKYVKTKNENDKVNENDELNGSSSNDDLEEKIISNDNSEEKPIQNNNKQSMNDDINIDDLNLPNLSDVYGMQLVDKNIANINLKSFKILLNKNNIKTIRSYGIFRLKTKSAIYNPQKDFHREWVSWSDLFMGETFTYDESKEFIRKNLDVLNINTPLEWHEYYDSIVKKELANIDISPTYISDFNKLPSQPKDYYKDLYKGLDDFLGKNLDYNIIKVSTGAAPFEKNADSNMKLIINNDDKKVLKPLIWNDMAHDVEFTALKEYINILFNIKCIIQTKIKFKNSGRFDGIKLLFSDKINPNKIIGNIDPLQKFLKYDKDFNKPFFSMKDKPMFSEIELIKSVKVIQELNNLKIIANRTKIITTETHNNTEIIPNKKDDDVIVVPGKKEPIEKDDSILNSFKSANHGTSWDTKEDNKLVENVKLGKSIDSIAREHKRSQKSIEMRIEKLQIKNNIQKKPIDYYFINK